MRGSLYVIRHPAPANVDPAVHQLILTAIHERRLLRFLYHDKDRIVEPQDYGIQKGVVHLFTYQTAGESSSSRLPDWRKFAVMSMSNVELLDDHFPRQPGCSIAKTSGVGRSIRQSRLITR